MDNVTFAAARRFPLLGRPRPACPALPLRVQEVTDAVTAAERHGEHGLNDAAHALNKAALIASDCGMPDLAEDWCWRHINAYQQADRSLTVIEARYLLEPVLNLARLQLRAEQGDTAVRLLDAMYQAVTQRHDLTIADQRLTIGDLIGDPPERRQLREWVWLQLVSEGVKAYVLAGRWNAAAEHARRLNGIGDHLMEGRQAAIIAACQHDNLPTARALLTHSTITQPWEQEVATCLHIMCSRPDSPANDQHLDAAVDRYRARDLLPGYASYRARFGLTIATLSYLARPHIATTLLWRIAEDAIDSGDGYAARDVLGFREPVDGISNRQRDHLTAIATGAGLGLGAMPEPAQRNLDDAVTRAEAILRAVLDHPRMTARATVTSPRSADASPGNTTASATWRQDDRWPTNQRSFPSFGSQRS